ncbi:MAG: 4Fe-4S binding protein [Rhodocyclaceae bacterium]|nr:4Fe-4S binding protein [Rhodocyclaceae bacterium]
MEQKIDIKTGAPLAPSAVQVDNTLCSRYRCAKSDCAACVIVCSIPGAIHLIEEGGVEVAGTCIGCGACVSACSNGALRVLENDAHWTQRIQKQVQPGEVFRIACTWTQGQVNLVLPCLSRLTETLLLEPLRAGATGVELLNPGCATCGLRITAHQFQQVVGFAQMLCECAGFGTERITQREMPNGQAEEIRPIGRHINSRRALFRSVANRWETVHQSTPDDPIEIKPFREIVQHHSTNPKRVDLLALLTTWSNAKPTSKIVLTASVPLAQITVDSSCVGCNVCETLCPVGALSHREEKGYYTLELDAAQCTGCRVCEVVCYHHALHLQATVDLAVLFEQPRITLVSAPRRICSTCRESFLDESSEVCPSCRHAGDRRDSIARQFFMRSPLNA